jgi:hypothetical protein
VSDDLNIYRADFERPDGTGATTYVQAPTLAEAAIYIEDATNCASVSIVREWQEGTGDEPVALWHRICDRDDTRFEDSALLRCPGCLSEALIPAEDSPPGQLRCDNCGERFERGEAVVSVDHAESFAQSLLVRRLAKAPEPGALRRLTVLTPGADELPGRFGEDGEEVSPVDGIPEWMWPRLRELDALLSGSARLTLARDWEGFVVGLIDGDDRLDSIYFMEDGRVAYAGLNHPAYVATVAELLAD